VKARLRMSSVRLQVMLWRMPSGMQQRQRSCERMYVLSYAMYGISEDA
jgi:hypothetical protein